MRVAQAVIGSQYGDEGKGLVVDYLTAMKGGVDVTVVRVNGGCQAAHTVVTPEGVRHVFRHFGSGTLAGASTHLSKHMICNPIMFNKEWDDLISKGAELIVSVDPTATVTTPYEMLINQAVEAKRGDARHGSCGLGINETVERNDVGCWNLTVSDLDFLSMGHLLNLRDQWVEHRLRVLDLSMDDKFVSHIYDAEILERFLEDAATFRSRVKIVRDEDVQGNIIFEAAQGLQLDQKSTNFPHVTRSNTGLRNMANLAKDMKLNFIDAYYVTRAYTTRHGAGPMYDERDISQWFDVEDETNVPNDWQGSIRYGLLDLEEQSRQVALDVGIAMMLYMARPNLVITCMDQVKGRIPQVGHEPMTEDEFITHTMAVMMSYGPTRNTMKIIDQNWKFLNPDAHCKICMVSEAC